jgi:hypothetical protein
MAQLKSLEDREAEMLESLRVAYAEKEEAYRLLEDISSEAKQRRARTSSTAV